MTLRSRLAAWAICAAGCFTPLVALSHAALIEAETAQAIRLHAFYDTSEPMSHAQVIIFGPEDPVVPWGQAITDRDGKLEFVLGPEAGRWSFQVRQAGHGAMVHVDIDGETPVITAEGTPQGWGQRLVMIVLVAWGALGTALFARSRKRARYASS